MKKKNFFYLIIIFILFSILAIYFYFSPLPQKSQEISNPQEISNVDITSIKKAAEKRKMVKTQWESWLKRMKSDFTEIEEIYYSSAYMREEKKTAWRRFLDFYKRDNPNSSEDERLRQRAAQRLNELAKVKKPIGARVSLPTDFQSLTISEVETMIMRYNFFTKHLLHTREFSNFGDFKNYFEPGEIKGDKVVIDHTTGLMWHQSGIEGSTRYKGDAIQWIKELNSSNGYAGYHDWRMPTLWEAASLLERSKMNGNLYIDPLFSARQTCIWTVNNVKGEGQAWIVNFSQGIVYWADGSYFVDIRPVRSIQE